MTFKEILEQFEIEGFGYFVTEYASVDDMPDEKSKELFEKARNAMNEFRVYIERNA